MLNSFALSLRSDGTYEPFSAEAWKYVGEMILLGMGMIFAVLGSLWLVLAIFKLIFVGKTPKQPKEQKPKQKPTPAPKAQVAAASDASDEDVITAVIAASIQAIQEDEMRDTQLVALLTAAVAAYRAAEGDDGTFRVVSFKRSTNGRAWNARK